MVAKFLLVFPDTLEIMSKETSQPDMVDWQMLKRTIPKHGFVGPVDAPLDSG